MNVSIRNVIKEDLPSVVNIKIKGWQAAYKGIIEDAYLNNLDNEYEKRIHKMEENYMTNGFIVAEWNHEIVGFCRYVLDNRFSPEIETADGELCAIYVKPEMKRSGIGTKMFQYVIDDFKKNHKSKMVLWCLKDNEPAKEFYIKMGGKIIGEKGITFGEKEYQECCFEYDLL